MSDWVDIDVILLGDEEKFFHFIDGVSVAGTKASLSVLKIFRTGFKEWNRLIFFLFSMQEVQRWADRSQVAEQKAIWV